MSKPPVNVLSFRAFLYQQFTCDGMWNVSSAKQPVQMVLHTFEKHCPSPSWGLLKPGPYEKQHTSILKHSQRINHKAKDILCTEDEVLAPFPLRQQPPCSHCHFPQHSSWPMLGDVDTKKLHTVCALAKIPIGSR